MTRYFFLLPLTLKELNLVSCGTSNMFGLVGDILPQLGQPIFTSIAENKLYTLGS